MFVSVHMPTCVGVASNVCIYSTKNTSLCLTTDIDECLNDPCDDMTTCYNVNGTYFCACKEGYTLSGGSGVSGESSGSGAYCEGEYSCVYTYMYT